MAERVDGGGSTHMMAGGMFYGRQQFGELTSASVLSYGLDAGLTWRFGHGSCQRLPVPDQW